MIFFPDNKRCDYEIEVQDQEDFDFPREKEEVI